MVENQPPAVSSDADVRQRILWTAMALFARHGYAGTSVRRIAESSGLTKAGLYYHFGDKASLYRAAIGETSRYLAARVARNDSEDLPAADRVRALLHGQARNFVEEGDLRRLFYNNLFLDSGEAPVGDEIAAHNCALERALEACCDLGLLEACRLESVVLLLSGAIELCGAAWLLDPRHPEPTIEIADRLLAIAAPRVAAAAGIDESVLFATKGPCP